MALAIVQVTVKDVSDAILPVSTVPRQVELAERDHVTVKGVGRMNHEDSLALCAAGAASGYLARRIRDMSKPHAWGVRFKQRPVVAEIAEVDRGD